MNKMSEQRTRRQLWTVARVAREMGVTRQRVYQYIGEGRLPTVPARDVTGGAIASDTMWKHLIDPADVARLQHELETEPNIGGRPPREIPSEQAIA